MNLHLNFSYYILSLFIYTKFNLLKFYIGYLHLCLLAILVYSFFLFLVVSSCLVLNCDNDTSLRNELKNIPFSFSVYLCRIGKFLVMLNKLYQLRLLDLEFSFRKTLNYIPISLIDGEFSGYLLHFDNFSVSMWNLPFYLSC